MKSTLTLVIGSIITQILAICISPVMTRIYSENQIGEYTIVLTAVSMFGSIICGRYDMSIVSEPDNRKVFSLIKLSFFVTLFLSFIIGLGYTIYCFSINEMSIGCVTTFFSVFLLLLFTGLGYILISYNNRNKEYKLMTSVQVIREVGRDVVLIVLGYLGAGTYGLLIAQGVSVLLGLHWQAKSLKKNINDVKKCKLREVREVAVEHKKQPLFSVPASFANNYSYSVLNLFVNNMYGLDMLGYYSMSFRMLGLPLSLISVNVSKVFFEKAARDYDKSGNFRKIFLSTAGILLIIAIPMVILLVLFAPQVFELFFGKGWSKAGEFVRCLAPMFGIRLVVSSLAPTMTICNKQNWELALQMLFFIASLFTYFICKGKHDIFFFLRLISLLYSLIYILYFAVLLKFTKTKENRYG